MAFGFYLPTQAAVVDQWVPEHGPDFPLGKPLDFPEQLSASTAGGTLYIQEKGNALETFSLNFTLMSEVDRDALEVFFKDKARKMVNSFEYEDGKGVLHKVRWMNGFDFPKSSAQLYGGSIELRKVSK